MLELDTCAFVAEHAAPTQARVEVVDLTEPTVARPNLVPVSPQIRPRPHPSLLAIEALHGASRRTLAVPTPPDSLHRLLPSMLATPEASRQHFAATRVILCRASPELSEEDVFVRDLVGDAERGVHEALDRIFTYVQEQFAAARFDAVDAVLRKMPARAVTAELLVGMLAATLPARGRLRARSAFAERVARRLEMDQVPNVDLVLEGLR